jgi:hypothetical protein
MNRWQHRKQDDEDEGRQDCQTLYCPRRGVGILLVSSRCFYDKRGPDCQGCIFDQDLIYVKLILIMCQILEERGN